MLFIAQILVMCLLVQHKSFGQEVYNEIDDSYSFFKRKARYSDVYIFDDISINPNVEFLQISLSRDKSIDFEKLNLNNRVESIEIYAKSDGVDIGLDIFNDIRKLKNIKFASINFDDNFKDYGVLYGCLSRMDSLIGLEVNRLPYDESDLKDLRTIFSKLEQLVIKVTTEIPQELCDFKNLKCLGFRGYNMHDSITLFKNKISSTNLNTIAFEYQSSNAILEHANKIFPNISSVLISSYDSFSHDNFEVLSTYKNLDNLTIKLSRGSLSKNISNLINLKSLSVTSSVDFIGYQKYGEFNFDYLYNLKKLKKLYVSSFEKITANDKINFPQNIESIVFNYISNLNIDFKYFSNNKLKSIELTNCSLSSIPSEIYSFKALEYFNLSGNNIASIDSKIKQLKKLVNINLSNNKIKSLPNILSKLQQLKRLNVSNNLLDTLHSDYGNLKKMEYLNCNSNYLRNLPISFKQLKSLKYLNLNCNKFSEIPQILENLQKLEYLSFNNDCEEIPGNRYFDRKVIKSVNLRFPSLKQLHLNPFVIDRHSFESLWSSPLNFEVIKVREIESLPSFGWGNKNGSYLNLGKIIDDKIPDSLFDSKIRVIELFTNKGFFTIKDDISKKYANIVFEKLPYNIIKNDTLLLDYIIKKNKKNIFDYKIMFDIDSMLTLQRIDIRDFISTLKTNKKFKEAIYFADIFLRDSINIASEKNIFEVINSKNYCLSRLNRNEEVIKNTIFLDSVYNYNNAIEIGFYYLSKGNLNDARRYFNKNINERFYFLSKANEGLKSVEYLNLIESLFVAEDFKTIDSLFMVVEKSNTNFKDLRSIYTYLKQLRRVFSDSISIEELEQFKDQINSNESLKTKWSCGLISKWCKYLDQNKRNIIDEMNNILCSEESSISQVFEISDENLKYQSKIILYK